MNTKPHAYLKSWQWNNAWFISQERPVTKIGLHESLQERNIPLYKAEECLTPIHEIEPFIAPEIPETRLEPFPQNETHPLWQENPAYTYGDRTWLPKNCQMKFASALTNSVTVNSLPKRVSQSASSHSTSDSTIERLEILIKNAYIGDPVQKLLPRNWKIPYIGWHPVESVMRPRNLYDHTKYSWGRTMPREYGVPNARKVLNLSRALSTEILRESVKVNEILHGVNGEQHRQFLTRPNGKLFRLNISVPLSLYGRKPLTPNLSALDMKDLKCESVPSVAPLDPLATLHPTNIYQTSPAHPILTLSHSHPFSHTVFDHYTSHIAPEWKPEVQMAKSLMMGFCAAVGQARLRWGQNISGDLPEPVAVNIISTDGQRYQLSSYQLNSLDLDSDITNIFWTHPESLELFTYCGYEEAKVKFSGLDIDAFSLIKALITDDVCK